MIASSLEVSCNDIVPRYAWHAPAAVTCATMPGLMTPTLGDDDYRRLLELRSGLRRFLRWSEQAAQSAGLTPAQHQLLLAVRGHDDPRGPTVGDVAEHLLLRHHSAVGLIDRAETA